MAVGEYPDDPSNALGSIPLCPLFVWCLASLLLPLSSDVHKLFCIYPFHLCRHLVSVPQHVPTWIADLPLTLQDYTTFVNNLPACFLTQQGPPLPPLLSFSLSLAISFLSLT